MTTLLQTFIHVTPIDSTKKDRVHVDQIILYRADRNVTNNKDGSTLILTHGHALSVRESPEQIDAMVGDAEP